MHQDWVSWQIYMEKTVGEKEAANIERVLEKLPQEWDVQGAAEDVQILSKFYNYEPAELVAQDERNRWRKPSSIDLFLVKIYLLFVFQPDSSVASGLLPFGSRAVQEEGLQVGSQMAWCGCQ